MIDAQNKTTTLYSYQNGIGANTEAILNRTLRRILYGDLYGIGSDGGGSDGGGSDGGGSDGGGSDGGGSDGGGSGGDTNWDIEYVLNGTTHREVTGNAIPYQHLWKEPERFSSSLVINNTVTIVGQQAFRGWVNATSLTIGDSVRVIHPQAFQHWQALRYLMIPASVTEIWEEAFYDTRSLISITVLAANPPNLLNANAFNQLSLEPANIYVPAGSVGAYKAAIGWNQYAAQIFAIP